MFVDITGHMSHNIIALKRRVFHAVKVGKARPNDPRENHRKRTCGSGASASDSTLSRFLQKKRGVSAVVRSFGCSSKVSKSKMLDGENEAKSFKDDNKRRDDVVTKVILRAQTPGLTEDISCSKHNWDTKAFVVNGVFMAGK